MVLAKNEVFSLHKLPPMTYGHITYVLLEKDLRYQNITEFHATMLVSPNERIKHLSDSIESGAKSYNKLYPLHFACNGHQKIGDCPEIEKQLAIKEIN